MLKYITTLIPLVICDARRISGDSLQRTIQLHNILSQTTKLLNSVYFTKTHFYLNYLIIYFISVSRIYQYQLFFFNILHLQFHYL